MTFALAKNRDPGLEAARAFVQIFLKAKWPQSVIERASDREWYVYRDLAAKQSWDDWGRINENVIEMVHVNFSKGG